jgi:hypothetical protein
VTVFSSATGPTLQDNWFEGNSAGAGGGLNLDTDAAPLVDANTFVTNTAAMGGGIYTYATHLPRHAAPGDGRHSLFPATFSSIRRKSWPRWRKPWPGSRQP